MKHLMKHMTHKNVSAVFMALAVFMVWCWIVSMADVRTAHEQGRYEAQQEALDYTNVTVSPCALDASLCPDVTVENEAVEDEQEIVQATAFSQYECGSYWCETEGYTASGVVAVAPWIHQTYAPKRVQVNGAWYDVLPAQYPASGTDVDIWYGSDHAGALAFGKQHLPFIWE